MNENEAEARPELLSADGHGMKEHAVIRRWPEVVGIGIKSEGRVRCSERKACERDVQFKRPQTGGCGTWGSPVNSLNAALERLHSHADVSLAVRSESCITWEQMANPNHNCIGCMTEPSPSSSN